MALGGPDTYTGRSLVDAHATTRQQGMDDGVFDHFLAVFAGVLTDLGVPDEKIGELAAVLEGARGQVLDR